MEYTRESIFISAIRAFFNTLLGTVGVFIAIIPTIIILAIFSRGPEDVTSRNKLEILSDHKGNMKMLSSSTPAILRVNIDGIIGAEVSVKASEIDSQLLESRKGLLKHNRVKAVLLHINSPGGTVVDSDNIYRNILLYKKKYNVPVYAYTDGLCASGGLYIACSADKIYSSHVSLIGSVGVKLGPFFNFYDTMQKYGMKSQTLTKGKDKDAMNPFRKWSADEDSFFDGINNYYYKMFVDIVSKARNIDKEAIINQYGAHVFDPVTAEKIHYIDKANISYNDTLVELLKAANLDPDKNYQVVTLLSKKTWLSPITGKAQAFFTNILKEVFSVENLTQNEKQDKFFYIHNFN